MQIKTLKYPKKITTFLMLIILLRLEAVAQRDCNCDLATQATSAGELCLPYMWKESKGQYRDHFNKSKKDKLSIPGKSQTDSFYLGKFLDMLRYVDKMHKEKYSCFHIYLCAYTEGSPNTPKGEGDKITLVFAPAEMKNEEGYPKDLGVYYHLPPDLPFNASQISNFIIDESEFKEWHDNYMRTYMKKLRSTITDSEDNREDEIFRDTRAITYCRKDLCELIREQSVPHTKDGIPVTISTDMIARLAAYPPDKTPDRTPDHTPDGEFTDRLFVQFDYVVNGNVIDLKETGGFGIRDKNLKKCEHCKRVGVEGMQNNGQLCPPSVNCPSHKTNADETKKNDAAEKQQ